MRKKTLRVLSSLMCLFFLASLFQAPLMAAVETIPVRVGNQTLNVTPGQWVSVRSGTQITHYNVRFVDGKPVALEMSQYTKLVFGDAGVAGSAGSVADDVAQASSGSNKPSTSKPSTSKPSTSKPSGSSNQSSGSNVSAGSVADDVAQAGSTQGSGSKVSNSQGSSNVSAGSVADDVAQTSGRTPQPRDPQTGRFISRDAAQGSSVSAGTVADDVAAAGSTSTGGNAQSPVSSSQGNAVSAGTVADDVAAAGQSSVSTNKTTTTTSETTTRTWDPARHPRDPQTGRFISHEEAIKRGLMDPPAGGSVADDVAQSGSSSQSSQSSQTAGSTADDVAAAGSTADDVAAAGSTADDVAAAGSTADDVAQAGALGAGSVADDAAQASGNKATIGDKFRAGYETGKGMTNQGFQNVKDSLKSGFSAKNILITAGITVGVDLATQIMRGEKPSMKKALKTVCSAEFAGGVGGAVLGAAAGSFFVPFLSAVPVVGGVLSALAPSFGSIVGSSVGAYVAGDLKNGKFSIREAFKRIDWVGVTGQAIGSTAGAALGSFLGPVGTVVGGMVGGYLGNWAAQKIAGMFRKDGPANMPEIAMPTGAGVPVGGGVITIGGDESTPAPTASQNDTVTISGEVVGDYESEVALAYSKYQELYKLYNEMLRQGRQDDALKVADAMNAAKKEYDTLRTSK
ncbi:MAG TPA: hypothetical protein PLK28_19125 [Candidatus Rifleibacterium sp.]|nr:hypothetical protein [Candidatus Rifleibacterium sp.]